MVRRLRFAFAILLVSLAAAPVLAANRLANGSFTSGISGWSSELAIVTVSWQGGGALRALYTGPTFSDVDAAYFFSKQSVSVVPGQIYRLGGRAFVLGSTAAGRGARVSVCFPGVPGSTCTTTSPVSGPSGAFVALQEKSVTVPQGATRAEFSLILSAINGLEAWFDDVYLDDTGGVAAPVIDFTAAPSPVISGDPITLEWSATDATTVSIDNGIGAVDPRGTRVEYPGQDTSYKLTATGPGGTSTETVDVDVTPRPVILQASIQTDATRVAPGDPVTVSWSTTGATSVQIDGIGGSLPPSGYRIVPATGETYTLRASNAGQTVTSAAKVDVTTASPPSILSFTAEPESVGAGEDVRLSWSSTGGNSAHINPEPGGVALSSSSIVRPLKTTIYTLRVNGDGGTVTRSVEVRVAGQTTPAVDTSAGRAGDPGSTDGDSATAQFRDPAAIGVDEKGIIYLVDSGNHTIRRIDQDGKTETWAGQAGEPGFANGYRTNAQFNFTGFAGGFFVDKDGTIKVRDTERGVRRIDPVGNVSDCPDRCGTIFYTGEVYDLAGTQYVVDAGTHMVRRRVRRGTMTDFAGVAGEAGFVDGTGAEARFNRPRGVAVDQASNVYVGDSVNNAIRKISPSGVVTTVAGGTGAGGGGVFSFGGSGGELVMGGNGLLYVPDPGSNTIKSVNPVTGEVRTVAGSGSATSGDGSGAGASFRVPVGIAIVGDGDIIIADKGNHTVRRVDVNAGLPGGLAMLDGRFVVDVRYRNQFASPPAEGRLLGRSLYGSATSDTAIFWFDDPTVVEFMVRLSDARPFENRIHLYYGGLSDVELFITVSDTLTGKSVEYGKAPNVIVGNIDRASFVADPAGSLLRDAVESLIARTSSWVTAAADSSTIQLLGNRYEVRVRYRNQFATPATAGYLLAKSIASSTGTETAVFYFNDPESVEWMVRFSDARPFDNHNHFFHGGLTDVELTIEVTDTLTGLAREYAKPANSLAGGVDRTSFVP